MFRPRYWARCRRYSKSLRTRCGGADFEREGQPFRRDRVSDNREGREAVAAAASRDRGRDADSVTDGAHRADLSKFTQSGQVQPCRILRIVNIFACIQASEQIIARRHRDHGRDLRNGGERCSQTSKAIGAPRRAHRLFNMGLPSLRVIGVHIRRRASLFAVGNFQRTSAQQRMELS